MSSLRGSEQGMESDGTETGTRWRRPPPTPREARLDVVLGLALAVAALGSFELARSVGLVFDRAPGRFEQSIWALAVTLPLCVRRRYPVPVMIAVSAAFIALQARYVFEGLVSSSALFLAVFTAGAWARDRRVGLVARLVVVVAMFCWLGISLSLTAWHEVIVDDERTGLLATDTARLTYSVLTNVVYFGGAVVFGDLAWRAARTRNELHRRNAELEVERTENARRAVIEERVRIARELHDVVAHHVSVMGVQAGAARHVLDSNPEAARTALTAIEASSRDAVAEMRQLLGVLRAGDETAANADATGPDRSPSPGVEALAGLVGRLDRPGLAATFVEIGEPRPLSRGTSVSLFRVAQEAMTNTVRHANASRVDVRLRWLDSAVEVEVVDDGRGTGSMSGSGLGLVGMRERVALHGGVLDAGPRPVGGFRVRARVALAAGERAR